MQRIATSTKKVDLFGAGKHGYTDGTPSVEAATVLNSAAMNSLQEEKAGLIEDTGAVLNSGLYNQTTNAIRSRIEINALLNSVDVVVAGAFNDFATNGAGLIVGVGDAGLIKTSVDGGLTWTSRTPGSAFAGQLYRVLWAAGPALFVVIGGDAGAGSIQTSPDGITWTQRQATTAGYGVYSLAYSGALFVAFYDNGTDTKTYTSADALTWTAHAQAVRLGISFGNGCAFGAGLFVAGVGMATNTHLYTSTDGITWTSRTLGSSGTMYNSAITYANGMFAAYGRQTSSSTRELQTSPDGITWTRQRTGTGDCYGLLTTGSVVCAFGAPSTELDWQVFAADANSAMDFKHSLTHGAAVKSLPWFGRTRVFLSTTGVSGHLWRSPLHVL